jgi:hypothetical protein
VPGRRWLAMPDLTWIGALILLTVGPAALTFGITRNYYENRYGAVAAALEWLVTATSDENCRDLDHALAYADDVLEGRSA